MKKQSEKKSNKLLIESAILSLQEIITSTEQLLLSGEKEKKLKTPTMLQRNTGSRN
ncbi:MAG: hypothetical protein SFU25_05060 [Candidatus Caenarcaniphilales bacterium]|nr:hypothetical protein [Candidatus Caenarcaniphilales bacterium]